MAAIATFALKPGVWFRRVRLVIVSPDSQRTACLLSGRNSTYRPVQISGTGSIHVPNSLLDLNPTKYEPIDAKVYDTLAQANEAIRRAPAKAKGVMPFAYYRGAGGAVIAPTIFSAATTPRIIATLWEAHRLLAESVQHDLASLALGIVAGMIFRA